MTASKRPEPVAQTFVEVLDTYNEVLRDCYHALDAGAPQSKRDALREVIRGFVDQQRTRLHQVRKQGGLDGDKDKP